MQGKVSMVITCYNKADYIGNMLESIIAQEWKNIELILVNDGSSDMTREIISEYEQRLISRGFEVVVIDQKNAGVCAAAIAGFELMSGDYVCCVDADDELDPCYCSIMASWLENNVECDYCVCECEEYTIEDGIRERKSETMQVKGFPAEHQLEYYILGEMLTTVWRYMVRRRYFEKCCILQNYYSGAKGSHEPSFIIPLLANSGIFKYFDIKLYRFNVYEGSHSRVSTYEGYNSYQQEYGRICLFAISKLTSEVKRHIDIGKIECVIEFRNLYHSYESTNFSDGRVCKKEKAGALIEWVNSHLTPCHFFTLDIVDTVIKAVREYFLHRKVDFSNRRLIIYGCLGTMGQKYLPLLERYCLRDDDIMWDKNGDGLLVNRPDFSSLTSNDIILLLPIKASIYNEVSISAPQCCILTSSEIYKIIACRTLSHG